MKTLERKYFRDILHWVKKKFVTRTVKRASMAHGPHPVK